MAFHVACPITCRRICFCSVGFPQGGASKDGFLEEVFRIQEFLEDPWGNGRAGEKSAGGGIATVQVAVPRVEPPPPPPAAVIVGNAAAEEAAQTKRVLLQRKAAAVTVAAEDYARRFELGDLMDATRDPIGDELVQSNVNVMCRICFSGENEGSEKARKMLSCKTCGKKYHRSCLKNWGQHRDLFHWSSWTCPSCRTCEVCRRTGDPNKFMFCRRCDGAYHCYCQQPPHKNVSSGPYLCPKHTRCFSCGSNVPGNGLSVRWFLGYTCCDACGRLFVKGNYCPVCLKVYRDSESTPMVCCDVCQRWVHCQCDGISDEKYTQFQVDGNLQYKCATCRCECYQVKDLEDAVHELWRRKDIADQDLIASLRAATGLPTQEGAFSIFPYSDDEESGLSVLKNESGRSINFSLKGLVDKSPMKIKEYGNKSSNKPKRKGYERSSISKKEPRQILEGQNDVHSSGHSFDGDKNDNMQSPKNEEPHKFSPVAGSPSLGLCFVNQPGGQKHKFVDEVVASDENRISKGAAFKNKNPFCLDSGEDDEKISSKSKAVKTKKLVINLGSRKINLTQSPMSNASTSTREQDLMVSNGHEEASHQRVDKLTADRRDSITNNSVDSKGDTVGYSTQVKGLKLSGNCIKLGKVKPNRANMHSETDDNCRTPVSNSLAKESKLSLKFKIRNPQVEDENSTVPGGEEERSFIKGQRSKRKRPSLVIDRSPFEEDQNVTQSHDDMAVDARILKRLGKESIGKVVEVHQSADDSWHRGVVTDVIVGTSKLSVTLDSGRVRTLELEKQGVRFAPQKQKRLKH